MDYSNDGATTVPSPKLVTGLAALSALAGASGLICALFAAGPLRYVIIGISLLTLVASTTCAFVAGVPSAERQDMSDATSSTDDIAALGQSAILAAAERKERDIMTALNFVPDGVVAMDKNARIIFINAAAAELSGCEAATAPGQLADMLFPLKKIGDGGIFPSPGVKSIISAFVTRSSDLAQITGTHGRTKYVRSSAHPLYDDEGSVTGAIMLLRTETAPLPQEAAAAHQPLAEPLPILPLDINLESPSEPVDTERADLFQKLLAVQGIAEAERESAREAKATQSSLLASISDELRTPLHTVIGYCEMLEEETVGTDAAWLIPDIQKIRSAGAGLLVLVNDMLNLSKLESGKVELFSLSFEVQELVETVVSALLPVLDATSNLVEINCSADAGIMNSDPTKLRQCLFTLLLAASRNRTKRTISIDVTRDVAGDSPVLRFRISDAGLVLSATGDTAPLESVELTSRRPESLSLSLAITHTLCRMMNGFVEIGMEPGVGRSVTLILPVNGAGGRLMD